MIVGPSAVGKTEISLQLAERLRGEIVSADSRLFYRGLDIGTAKPSPAEQARVPHHLIDIADPHETWSLALFQQAAIQAIADIHQRSRLPFLVGGTGQYIRAVTHGWTPPAQAPHPRLRTNLETLARERSNAWLHSKLAVLDPLAAEIIDPRNLRRTIRALEVILSTGKRFSEQRGRSESPYRLLTIGLNRPRPELYARLDARIQAMFANGLLDEVQRLLDRGYSPDLPSLSAIGYRECVMVLQGKLTQEQARQAIQRATRVFVRRQANWFKQDDPTIHWFDAGQTPMNEMVAYVMTRIAE
ncbi:MAG: tRNA (adenosine(37)-N6)-dimethylallyltransferase MiaA [Anaerolineales bacterium]|nr:tRNA (adenosine(37)-N6)-dimethylallyltransferase MiaA [Anaerolineales bacterium]